jgi:hypothetical protein
MNYLNNMENKILIGFHWGFKGRYLLIEYLCPIKKIFSFRKSFIPEINEKSFTITFLDFKIYHVMKTDLPF